MLVWASSRIEIEIGRLLLLFIISLLARFAVTPNILSLSLSLCLCLCWLLVAARQATEIATGAILL